MLLGFKRQFAPFVENGTNTHTLRGLRKSHKLSHSQRSPRVGETAHCYVDPRQKTMRLLGRFPIVKVDPVTLDFEAFGIAYRLRVTIADQTLSHDEAVEFARRDGFRGDDPLAEMARFWISTKRLSDALDSRPWHGQIIHWRYPDGD